MSYTFLRFLAAAETVLATDTSSLK